MVNKKRTSRIKTKLKDSVKYSFTLEFQLELLRYFIQSKDSVVTLLTKIKPGYFTLIEHSIIVEALVRFVKKYNRIPSEPMLVESISKLLTSREYKDLVIKEDIPNIHRILRNLYSHPLRDEDILKDQIFKFAAYIEMKNLNEVMDLSDFDAYESYQDKVANIIRDSKPPKKGDGPIYMVEGTSLRQMYRKIDPNVIPTPIKQLNKLTNGGGLPKHSIAVIIDRPKKKKTFAMINISRGYLSMKKNVLYIDLENGKNHIMERMVQSTLNKSKKDMLSGDFDKLEQKHMRKYKRLSVEFIVERLPAKVATANTIRALINKLEKEKGIKINIVVIDYAAKLAAISGRKDDVERIDDVYTELDNLATEMDLDVIWSAQHVTREGSKHSDTKYEENDIASAVNIVRNVQLMVGLNQTEEEEENGVQRLEIVVQRDGVPSGRALFNVDVEKQRWKEFSTEARKAYDETQGQIVDQMMKKGRRMVNQNADRSKASQKSGDI